MKDHMIEHSFGQRIIRGLITEVEGEIQNLEENLTAKCIEVYKMTIGPEFYQGKQTLLFLREELNDARAVKNWLSSRIVNN